MVENAIREMGADLGILNRLVRLTAVLAEWSCQSGYLKSYLIYQRCCITVHCIVRRNREMFPTLSQQTWWNSFNGVGTASQEIVTSEIILDVDKIDPRRLLDVLIPASVVSDYSSFSAIIFYKWLK